MPPAIFCVVAPPVLHLSLRARDTHSSCHTHTRFTGKFFFLVFLKVRKKMSIRLEVTDKGDVAPEEWNRMMSTIIDLTDSVCGELVTTTYIRDTSVKSAQLLITAIAPGTDDVIGFLIANDTEYPGYVYVDVVCSKQPGAGRMMLDIIEPHAEAGGYAGVALSSLPHVVGYYRRRGYRHREQCIPGVPEDPQVSRSFEELALPLIQKYKQDVVNYIDESPEGSGYRRFLGGLIKRRLSKDKECTDLDACNVHGYVMMKCFERSGGTSDTDESTLEAPPVTILPTREAREATREAREATREAREATREGPEMRPQRVRGRDRRLQELLEEQARQEARLKRRRQHE
jgi:hypothetical protein